MDATQVMNSSPFKKKIIKMVIEFSKFPDSEEFEDSLYQTSLNWERRNKYETEESKLDQIAQVLRHSSVYVRGIC